MSKTNVYPQSIHYYIYLEYTTEVSIGTDTRSIHALSDSPSKTILIKLVYTSEVTLTINTTINSTMHNFNYTTD